MIEFERRSQPLLPRKQFFGRLARSAGLALAILVSALLIGILGYHGFAHLSWLDALLNASMILSGMGPVDLITTDAGKWFASIYALMSGVVFLTSVGVFLSPALHRFLHRFHLEDDGVER